MDQYQYYVANLFIYSPTHLFSLTLFSSHFSIAINRFVLRRQFSRASSSCGNSSFSTATSSNAATPSFASLQQQYRKDILNAALNHVHQHGWTEDAIANGIVSDKAKKYPPSFIGMMEDNHSKASDLIHFFMKECNLKLKSHLESIRKNGNEPSSSTAETLIFSSHANLLKYCIQYRLEMTIPYVKSNRWSEGMALGATPYNAMSTASHLGELVSIMEDALSMVNDGKTQSQMTQKLNPLERTGIGAVYVATELHLLADTSPGYTDTWNFLNDRINELDMIQQQQSLTQSFPQLNQETMVAGLAVASSLGSAVLSLMTPVARNGVSAVAGTIVPQVMNLMAHASSTSNIGGGSMGMNGSTTPGATAEDYDFSDLPPFDEEEKNEPLQAEKR